MHITTCFVAKGVLKHEVLVIHQCLFTHRSNYDALWCCGLFGRTGGHRKILRVLADSHEYVILANCITPATNDWTPQVA